MTSSSHSERIVIVRTFDAPRELVWRAWSEPDLRRLWWGPKIFTSPSCAIDFRVGGKYLFCMRSGQGQDLWSTGVFKEIVYPEKIVYPHQFADEKGNVVSPSSIGVPGEWPDEVVETVTFEDVGGKTRLTLTNVGVPDVMKQFAEIGWNEEFDKLISVLSSLKV